MKKAILLIILTALLLIAGTGATVAWLTASTTPKENVFTIGDISMTLTEPGWDANTPEQKTIVPGKTIIKDPTVTVARGSEKCYVFVEVEVPANLSAVFTYAIADGWTALTGVSGVYYRIADKNAASDTTIAVIKDNKITISDNVTKVDLDKIDTAAKDNIMTITAYAIQYEFISSNADANARALEAWNEVSK